MYVNSGPVSTCAWHIWMLPFPHWIFTWANGHRPFGEGLGDCYLHTCQASAGYFRLRTWPLIWSASSRPENCLKSCNRQEIVTLYWDRHPYSPDHPSLSFAACAHWVRPCIRWISEVWWEHLEIHGLINVLFWLSGEGFAALCIWTSGHLAHLEVRTSSCWHWIWPLLTSSGSLIWLCPQESPLLDYALKWHVSTLLGSEQPQSPLCKIQYNLLSIISSPHKLTHWIRLCLCPHQE